MKRCLMMCVTLVITAMCTVPCPADEVSPPEREFVFYNIVPFSPGREKKLAADLREYVARTGNRIALYSMTLHPQGVPANKKVDFQFESYRKLKTELAGSDVRLGVLLQSLIGHWPRVDSDEEPWTRTVDCDGRVVRYCVLDPNYRDYVRRLVLRFAQERPSFVMTDDDVRWFSHRAECFCALHTAEFNRRTGQELTSEEYRRRVAQSKVGDADYEAYLRLQNDSMTGLAQLIREALDSVDPAIPAGTCMAPWDVRYCGEIAKVIAGKNPSVFRIANAMYNEWSAKVLPENVLRTQAMRLYHKEISCVLDESDTFAHTLYSRSSKSLHAKLCTGILSGLRGAKVWFVNLDKRDGHVSENYVDILSENKGLYQTLAREVRESEPEGVIVPLYWNLPEWHPVRPNGRAQTFMEGSNWGTVYCGELGIPFYGSFDRKRDGIYLLAGAKSVERFSDAELLELLAGKLLIDGAAATALAKRGMEKYIGVKPELKPFKYTIEATPGGDRVFFVDKGASVPFLTLMGAEVLTKFFYEQWSHKGLDTAVAPATVFYRNAIGGCVVTTANCVEQIRTYTLSPARKAWLLSLLDRLSGTQVPYTVVGEQNVLALSVKKTSGETILGVFNLNFDTMKTLSIRCARTPTEIERLGGDGVWRRESFISENGVALLPIPLTCYDCAFLKIK